VDDLKQRLKEVVTAALTHFKYNLEDGADEAKDGLSESEDENDLFLNTCNEHVTAKGKASNYYKQQVKEVENRNQLFPDHSDESKVNDDGSAMTQHVLKHRNYVRPSNSKNTMCSTRAAMESMAYQSQQRQANKINYTRINDTTYKQQLDVGDIGVVYVKPKTRNSCDHPYLPVMVTEGRLSGPSQTVLYKLCCQYGYLKGNFSRDDIRFEEHMTADIVLINTEGPNFGRKALSVEEASAKYNVLGGKTYCRCKKDCTLVRNCSCIALGKLCRDKCHRGKESSAKNFHCSNCVSQHNRVEESISREVKRRRTSN
jgi:hypothetical protein